MDCCYRITKKELHKIAESTTFEDFQQEKQLKCIANVTQKENNDVDFKL